MSAGKQLKVWSLTLVALATLGGGLYYYKSSQIASQASQQRPEYPEPIGAVAANFVDYKEVVRVPAEIVAPDSVFLTTELAGKIHRLNIENGQAVKKGDLLLQLDISEEQASLKTAKARAELAKADLKRVQSVYKQKLTSEEALDQAIADVKINQAEVERIQAVIDKKSIYAPFDGELGLHEYSVGEYLPANTQVTSLVADKDHLWVDVSLSQSQARLLSDEQMQLVVAGNTLPVFAQVVAKEPLISVESRSLRHRAKLMKQDAPDLTPGAFIEVMIKQGQPQPMIKLPKQAVLRQQASRYVYVLQPQGEGTFRVQRRDIQLFQENGEYSYVAEGLQPGEQVVTTGAFKLYPNKLVSIQANAPQATDAAQ